MNKFHKTITKLLVTFQENTINEVMITMKTIKIFKIHESYTITITINLVPSGIYSF